MPELPEVETIGNYLKQHILDTEILQATVRNPRLRWPIPNLNTLLSGYKFNSITRRSKYLLLNTQRGTAIIHLGMSGRLIITDQTPYHQNHEHVTISFANLKMLRFIDPRRFGAFLWTEKDPLQHDLLKKIGPEPLTSAFSFLTLKEKGQKKRVPIKQFIMDGQVVAGVGNIYANEALFMAKINPQRATSSLDDTEYKALTATIKEVLKIAIAEGGSSIRDYVQGDGEVGRFQQMLKVYGRTNRPCPTCSAKIQEIRLGQRNTFYCPKCQK